MKQIVVLTGGRGTRLYPLTKSIPKYLMKINNIPFLGHQLNLFKRNKIESVILCLGYLSEKIIEYIGDGSRFGLSVQFSVENSENLLGTLGALKKAENLLHDNFFVIWGDSYLETDFQHIGRQFLKTSKLGLMTVYKNKNQLIPSNIAIKDGLVIDYEKNKCKNFDYVDYGLSLFNNKVLNFFSSNKKLDIAELNKKLISMNQLAAYEVRERFYEIGSFSGIKELEKHLNPN